MRRDDLLSSSLRAMNTLLDKFIKDRMMKGRVSTVKRKTYPED